MPRERISASVAHLVKELEDNGMKLERIMHLLNEHVFESYGKEYRDIVMENLKS
jgi:hypothetical protein